MLIIHKNLRRYYLFDKLESIMMNMRSFRIMKDFTVNTDVTEDDEF